MGATEMQILGIVLIAAGVIEIAAAQVLLSLWLKKIRQESMQEERQ